jgi:hypothetical protein
MENPTTWRDFRLSSPGFDRTEFIVWNGAKRFGAFHFHSIRSSDTRRLSPSVRCRERRPTLRRFAAFVQIRVIRRNVTPRHRRSVLHGNPNYVV